MKRIIVTGLISFVALSPAMTFAQMPSSSTERRQERQERMEERREQMQTQMEQRRETMRERLEERRTALETKLAAFRDQNRAAIVSRLSANLDKVNEVLTTRAAAHIEKLNSVLDRIEAGDTDNSGDTDIDAAGDAIDAAADAVADQAEKTYALTITDEQTVGTVASAARAQLRADLEAMFNKIKDAREAVRKAAVHIDNNNDADDEDGDDDDASSTDE